MRNAKLVRAVKEYVKQPHAWPGGYPLMAITDDCQCLCPKCVKGNFSLVMRSTRDKARDGWQIRAVAINWEDGDLLCSHCNKPIESAYGMEG